MNKSTMYIYDMRGERLRGGGRAVFFKSVYCQAAPPFDLYAVLKQTKFRNILRR